MSNNKDKLNKIYFAGGAIALLAVIVFMFFAFKGKPLTYNDLITKAESYAAKGQIAFAMEEYRKLLQLYPENYDVHVSLAGLYEQINEIDRAKVEYVKAIRLGHKNRPEAYIKLAKIYCNENRFRLAVDIVKDISGTKDKKALEKIGHIYFNWAETLKTEDMLESIRKFKQARVYYFKAKSKSEKKAVDNIVELYANIADDMVLAKQPEKALEVLKLSLEYEDNALAHYKLAQIYEADNKEKKALSEYSKSFELNPEVASTSSYINLLTRKAHELKAKGDDVNAEYYFKKAKKLDSGLKVPLNPDKRILFSLSATRVNEDMENDLLVPGISFKLINISPDIIEHLRVKVVFLNDGKPISTLVYTIADKQNSLNCDSSSSEVEVYSTAPIKHVFDNHDMRVQVYISQFDPDKWTLFRNIRIERERRPVSVVE